MFFTVLAWCRGGYRVRHVAALLFVAVVGCVGVTYWQIFHSSSPFGPDPRKVLPLVLALLVLLLSLAGLVTWQAMRLWIARRRGSLGSRMQVRVILMFSLVSMVPTVLVAGFSIMFFNQGIQAWFDQRVSTALEESVAVAQGYFAEHRKNIEADAFAVAGEVNRYSDSLRKNPRDFPRLLQTLAAIRQLTEARLIRSPTPKKEIKIPLKEETIVIDAATMKRALNGEATVLTSARDDRVRALVWLSAFPPDNKGEHLFLLVGRPVDPAVLQHMQQTKGSVDEYDRLKTNIGALQIQFSFVFLAVAFLLLFASLWAGMIFSGDLVKPITTLVAATERIKAGDLEATVEEGARGDEMGTLNRAFNRMTEQLRRHHSELTSIARQSDERRRIIEAVLAGVSAGVIALDNARTVTLHNRSAQTLLSAGEASFSGSKITDIFPEVEPLLEKLEAGKEQVLQQEISITRAAHPSTLLVRVVKEEDARILQGYVVTFDDITDLLSAQRQAAWADVARRIAHEIKNPLTPIHLAVDRLQRKYAKQITEDAETYHKYLDTITRHIGTIGHIVEEFVQFARMPAPMLLREDMAALARDAVFSEQMAGAAGGVAYALAVPEEAVYVRADKGQLGQVLTNLLKNAREALEGREGGQINVRVEAEEGIARVIVEDNGPGFPEELIDRITEPYVTTREKGTGLGLAIVKKVVSDHGGTLLVANRADGVKGARVAMSFPLSDQS